MLNTLAKALLLLGRELQDSSFRTADLRKGVASDDPDVAEPAVPHQARDLRWKRLLEVRQHLGTVKVRAILAAVTVAQLVQPS